MLNAIHLLSELEILKDVCARLEKVRMEYMLTGTPATDGMSLPNLS